MNGFLHFQLKSGCLTKQNHIIISNFKTTWFYFEIALDTKWFWCWLCEECSSCSLVCQVLKGCTRPSCCVCNSLLKTGNQRMLTDVWGARLRSPCMLFISTPFPLWQVPAYCRSTSKGSCHMPAHFSGFACMRFHVYSYAYMHTGANDIRSVFSARYWKQSVWRRGRIITMTALNSN